MKKKILGLLSVMLLLVGCTNKKDDVQNNSLPLQESSTLFKEMQQNPLVETKVDFNYPDGLDTTVKDGLSLWGSEKDKLYFVTEDGDSQLYLSYNLNTKVWNKLFSSSPQEAGFLMTVYEESVILGTGFWDENDCLNFTIVQYKGDEEKILYSSLSNGVPTAHVIDHYIVINEVIPGKNEKLKSTITIINLEDGKVEIAKQTNFTKTQDWHLSGDIVMCEGGWKDGFVYNYIELDNEVLTDSDAGKSSIFYYSFDNKVTEKLMDFPTSLFYMAGTPDFLITSNYSIGSEDTGKIIMKQKDHYKAFVLPGVVAGNDISDSFQLTTDTYFISAGDDYYVADLNTQEYMRGNQKKLVKGENDHYGFFKSDNGVSCLTKDKTKLTLHTFHIKA